MQSTTEKKGQNPFNAAQVELGKKNLRDLSDNRVKVGGVNNVRTAQNIRKVPATSMGIMN